MVSIKTSLTRLLNCRVPVISAPMAGVAGVELAIAVSQGGGFGLIGKGHESFDVNSLMKEFERARQKLGIASDEVLPIGVGVLCWRLEKVSEPEARAYLTAIVKNVKCIWLSFGADLSRWVSIVREVQPDDRRCKVAVMVTRLEEAEDLWSSKNQISASGIDIIVGQGFEAGGHGGANGETINAFIPALKNLLIERNLPGKRPALVAAGGLTHGSHLAAMLALGVDGIVCGTRLLATPEATYTDAQKQAILAAKSVDTIKTTLFDDLRGTVGWPDGIDGRALNNETIKDHFSGTSIEELKKKYQVALQTGNVNRLVTWSGMSVGLVTRVMSAKLVMEEIEKQAIECLIEARKKLEVD